MGRDNQSKERQARKLERKKPKRESYDRILIVSEGEKTEPQYFGEIRQHLKLNTANVAIMPSEFGPQPSRVVQFAHDKFIESRKFEQVYCVFDRDDHNDFDAAIQMASSWNGKLRSDLGQLIIFKAVPSVPCFELWLLLHFECATRHIHRNEVYRELVRAGRLPGYTKGQQGTFERTNHLLNTAHQNAETLVAQRNRHGNENPYTEIHLLVEKLISLKRG